MSAAPNRPPRGEIHFAPNTPVTVALKYNQGRRIQGQYGDRMMFTTPDDRVFFLSPEVAGKIEEAGVNVREPFTITQRWDGGKDSPRTWEVARIAGEQRDGTFAVPKLPPSPAATSSDADAVTPKPPATATAASPNGTRSRNEAMHDLLVSESICMVDAYAAVLKHALENHGGKVKPDEVKSIFLTCVINLAGGKGRAA